MKVSTLALIALFSVVPLVTACGADCESLCEDGKECKDADKDKDCAKTCEKSADLADKADCADKQDDVISCYADQDDVCKITGDDCKSEQEALGKCMTDYCKDHLEDCMDAAG